MSSNNVELSVKRFSITSRIAKSKNIPTSFEGIIVRETPKAVYIIGKGVAAPEGVCAACGRTLTHPGSILIGIGPECLGDWTTRDYVLDTLTPEDIERLKSLVTEKVIDSWIPKYCIKSEIDTGKKDFCPTDHKLTPISGKNPDSVKNIVGLMDDGFLKIEFLYNAELLGKVKSLRDRRWMPAKRYWTAPANVKNLEALQSWGFILDEKCLTFMKAGVKTVEDMPAFKSTVLNGKLMPFQEQGVSFLVHRKGKAIIGDEMGLGKTIQALGYIQLTPERPAIIVVPASLKLNWKKEAEKWIPNCKIEILSGKKVYNFKSRDIIIINYDILSAWADTLRKLEPKILVLDECHLFKSNGAQRTKAVKLLAKGIPHVIPMSGTPAINRPIELFNAIHIVEPSLFPNYFDFGKRYCKGHFDGYGWNFNGVSNVEELYESLKTVMVRRKKCDVLKDLPDKTRSFIPLTMSNSKEYSKACDEFLAWVKDTKGEKAANKASSAETLTRISALRQLSVKGALDGSTEWIKNFLEGSDEKLVVFAIHREIIDKLMEEFKGVAVKIDGSTPMNNRQANVDSFQSDPKVRLFIGNIKAAGVGITLTAASNVAFLELPWTPGELDQAEDRCHRIGQKNAVNIWYLLAEHSIEEDLAKTIDGKRKVLDAVLDGKENTQEGMLSFLIDNLSQ